MTKGYGDCDPDVRIETISDRLHLIKLDLNETGFRDFIGVWLYTGYETYLIDTGPANSAAKLVAAISEFGIRHLDYIFLTHIHLDHAGGVGNVAHAFNTTPIVTHKIGIPHLIDPERLWQGSLKTLGDVGRGYGKISPVEGWRFIAAQEFTSKHISLLNTPGHAPHHMSLCTDEFLFVGEAGGVWLPMYGKRDYLRPATPPKFFLETTLSSIDILLSTHKNKMCYGHLGIHADGHTMLKRHREQLLLWHDTIQEDVRKQGGEGSLYEGSFYDRCLTRLLGVDPNLEDFWVMPEDVQQRERFFLKNSIKGFVGYLNS